MTVFLLTLFGLSCTQPKANISAHSVPTGIELRGANTTEWVEAQSAAGTLIQRWTVNPDLDTTWIPIDWSQYKVVSIQAHQSGQVQRLDVDRLTTADTVRLAIPLGQDVQGFPQTDALEFPTIGMTQTQVGVSLTAMEPSDIRIELGDTVHTVQNALPGEQISLAAPIGDAAGLKIDLGQQTLSTRLVAAPLDIEAARQQVQIQEVRFPTDSRGQVDLARPEQRVTLPARWWSDTLSWLGLGVRPHDRMVPWGHVSVQLKNGSTVALNLSARIRVESDQLPDPSFTPTMRDVDDGTGWVSAQIRIPPGEETAVVLPLFVDEESLKEENRDRSERHLNVEVSSIGSSGTLAKTSTPLHIQRGSSIAAGGMLLGVAASIGGVTLMSLGLRSWMSLPTTTLVTIALFSTLSFVVNAATQLLGMGISSVLGPFAFLVTGLVDDTIRCCLLATLLFLRPRPGVCAMAIIVGWLLRAVILGSGGPADLLYLTGHVFFLEGCLWFCGLTRGAPLTSIRIGIAFSVCFTLSILTALSFNVVLYRLFYAEWYVLLNVVMSGLIFPSIASAMAVPFARSLQRVED